MSGIHINMNGVELKIKGEGEVFNDIQGDEISISQENVSLDVEGKFKYMNNIESKEKLEQDIQSVMLQLDPSSEEFKQLEQLLAMRSKQKLSDTAWKKALREHCSSFAEGVAANVLSNFLLK